MFQSYGCSWHIRWPYSILLSVFVGVSACSSSSDDKPKVDDPTGIPSMPADLGFTVQANDAELSWTASTDDGQVVGYNIIRDGESVKELLDATSFRDTMLNPEITYQYSVIAVDDDGNRSNPANVELTTLAGQPLPPIINSNNHVELLQRVFEIYTGNAYRRDILTLPDWTDPAYSGVPPEGPDLPDEANITCLNGGTAKITPFSEGASSQITNEGPRGWVFEFMDCQDDDAVLDGQLRRQYDRIPNVFLVSSTGLSIASQLQDIQYSGEAVLSPEARNAPYITWEVTDAGLSMTGGGSTFILTDANTRIYYCVACGNSATVSGEFVFSSDATNKQTVRARVLEELKLGASGLNMDGGMLELSADDGSKLVLKADNGDETSVTIEFSTDSGTDETIMQSSDLWAESLKIDFDSDIWPN